MTSPWLSYRRLSREERRIVRRAAILLPLTAVGVRLAGFRRWQSMMQRFGGATLRQNQIAAAVVARLVTSTACRLPIRTRCLERGIVLCALLRRFGIQCELRLGARKDTDGFAAHAWVESGVQRFDDLVSDERATAAYVPFHESSRAPSSAEQLPH